MTDTDFLREFSDALGLDNGQATLDTDLAGLEQWDSVAYLAVMTLVDEQFGVVLDPDQLRQARTVGDILSAARAVH